MTRSNLEQSLPSFNPFPRNTLFMRHHPPRLYRAKKVCGASGVKRAEGVKRADGVRATASISLPPEAAPFDEHRVTGA